MEKQSKADKLICIDAKQAKETPRDARLPYIESYLDKPLSKSQDNGNSILQKKLQGKKFKLK